MDSLSWDDLRIALAIAREGSVRGAARSLGVHHATVSRHLASIAEQLGARPFERHGRRFVPSEVGLEIIATAEGVEQKILDLERRVHGRDAVLRGTVRVSLGYAFLHELSDIAARLARELPGVQIEWVSGVELSNLSRREADVVVRVTNDPQENLFGRRVTRLAVGAYGSVQHKRSDAPRWVRWETPFDNPPGRWLDQHVDPSDIAAQADSPWTLYELVAGGVGVGLIPRILVDACPSLVRLPGLPEFLTDTWVLMHEDSRASSRVRAVMQILGDAIASRDHLFTGASTPVE